MIQKRGWYVLTAVCGVAVACVVHLAIAQDLDEDGAIVSEEMLLEDAVNGQLDGDVDDLLLDDIGSDVDVADLLSDADADAPSADDETLSADEEADNAFVDKSSGAIEADGSANDEVSQEATAEMAEAAADNAAAQQDAGLDSDDDLDLLVEDAIEDALAEGIPEPPELDTTPAAEMAEAVEPADDAAVEEASSDAAMVAEEAEAVEPVEDEPVESVVAVEPVMDTDADDTAAQSVPEAVEAEAVVQELPEAPAQTELSAEDKAQMAYNQTLEAMTRQEELRRQALEAHARGVLDDAESAASVKNYKEAERLFKEAKRYITDRPETRRTQERIRQGLADNYYAWAQALQRQGEIDAARQVAQQALAFSHPRASRLLTALEEAPAEKVEEAVVQAPQRRKDQPDFIAKQKEISDLLRDGRQHLINGEYERAQAKFEAVLQPRLDPQNTEAIRLIQKVAQKRYDRATMELEGTRRDMMTEVRQTWNPRDYGLAEAMTKKPETISEAEEAIQDNRDKIRQKMERIIIPEVDFRQANIHEVIAFLQETSVEFDPADVPAEEKGVNIMLSFGEGNRSTKETPAADSNDPFAAMVESSSNDEVSNVPLVNFTGRYLSLLDVLKLVTLNTGLKYRIESNTVVIVPFNAPDGDLVVRMYNVLPAVEEKIREVGSQLDNENADRATSDFISIESRSTTSGAADWKGFFSDMGVEWPDRSSIKYVRTIGKIVVKNTEKNLAIFEKVLEVLNVVPSQIEIEARFVEVTQTDLDSLGFEWLLDNTWQVAQKKGQGNLPASARQRIEVSAAGPNGSLTPGNRFIPEGLNSSVTAMDSVLKIGSVLTNPELSMVLHMLQQRGHADLLSAPKVTTKSGNEATMKVVTEYIYPREYTVEPGQAAGGADTAVAVPPVVSPEDFVTREVGVLLTVLPEVSTEGQMINLNMQPSVVSEPTWRDYGYDVVMASGTTHLRMEKPFFPVRSVSTSISIYNGATVVMGGMITEQRADVDDRVPLLGDIPLVGRLFRSSYEHSEKRNLLIFVTARLVDPNGLPIREQEDVPIPDAMVEAASEQ